MRFDLATAFPGNLFIILRMVRKNTIVLGILVLLSVSTSFFSVHYLNIVFLILFLSGIKFLLVAFQFMELKKAHPFWKILTIIFIVLFIGMQLVI